MTFQQVFTVCVTILFVAVLIELFLALTLFNWRTFQDDRRRRKASKQVRHGEEDGKLP